MYNARKYARIPGDPRRIHKTQERLTRIRLATRFWSPWKQLVRSCNLPLVLWSAPWNIFASGNCLAASGGGQVCAGIPTHAAFQDTFLENWKHQGGDAFTVPEEVLELGNDGAATQMATDGESQGGDCPRGPLAIQSCAVQFGTGKRKKGPPTLACSG